MLILGIESSCDDTSVALVDCSPKGCFVIKEVTASQIDLHKKYGGVVPELAGRAHAEKIVPLIEETLKNQPKPDAIAVTAGPGLITGLIVGVEAARTLSWAWNLPLIAVNHIWGHIHSVEINNQTTQQSNNPTRPLINKLTNQPINYPVLALIVSGGHTELILMTGPNNYQKIGATRDDAAGECFDKVAKLLNLPYPGGPKISALAKTGKTDAISFPRPMLNENNFDFSFAGLKTSTLYWLRDNKLSEKLFTTDFKGFLRSAFGLGRNDSVTINDFCASFEQAIVDVLVEKTLRAVKLYNPQTIILGGGVAANEKLRQTLAEHLKPTACQFLIPDLKYCTDNAAMIAVAGYYEISNKTDWKIIEANPNWEINF